MRVVLVLACTLIAIACTNNPSIDDSQVKASAATCDAVCNRLVALCGYAPEGPQDGAASYGSCSLADGGGYCDTQMVGYLDCFSTAPSCQDAWNCFNSPDEGGVAQDASDDASDATPE